MQNLLFSHQNLADSATLSGGSWQAARPLTNLQNRFLGKKARSANDSESSTACNVDLGAVKSIRLIAVFGHNLSSSAQYKLQLRSALGGGDLLAGHSAWQSLPDEGIDTPRLLLLFLDDAVAAQYLRVEISDTSNPDGWVELSRLWAGDVWQPSRNMAYGATFGLDDGTEVRESPAGVRYAGTARKRRTMTFDLEWLGVDEGFQEALAMVNSLGKTGQVLVCASPDEAEANRLRMTMLATLDPQALVLPQYGISAMRFNLEEVIG